MISVISSIYENLILYFFVSGGTKIGKKWTGLAALLSNIALLSVMNLSHIPVYLKISIFLITVTVMYAKILDRKISVVFFKSVIFLLVITLCDVFVLASFELISHTEVSAQMEKNTELKWILVGCSKLLCFIILSVFNDRFKFGKEKIYTAVYIPFITSWLTVFILGNMVLDAGKTGENFLIVTVTIMAFISSYVSMYLTKGYLEVKEIEKNNQLSVIQIENQYKYYMAKREELQNLQSLKHDLKNHLLVLESDSTKKEYLEGLLSRIEAYGINYNTGDEIIDVLLMEKTKAAEREKISVHIMVDAKALEFVDTIEKVTIFGNLLDNAIEACQKERGQEKYIRMNGKIIENFYMLICKNSYDIATVKEKNGKLISSKPDKKSHGIGMENIKRAVKKYNGEVIIVPDNKEFVIKIIIPIDK